MILTDNLQALNLESLIYFVVVAHFTSCSPAVNMDKIAASATIGTDIRRSGSTLSWYLSHVQHVSLSAKLEPGSAGKLQEA